VEEKDPIMHVTRTLTLAMAAALGLAFAPPASAGTLYQWTNPDGSASYTDTVKRIPKGSRDTARRIQTGDLSDYARYTPSHVRHSEKAAQRRAARLERLRAINAEPPAAAQLRLRAGAQTILQLDNRTSIAIPHDAPGASPDEPVVVEEVRVRHEHGMATHHVTVVRRGDRIVSIVKGEPSQSGGGWRSLRQALGE